MAHVQFAVANRYAVLDLSEIPVAGDTADASAAHETVLRYLLL
jgi:branched-chain amino acid transport system ATP-binding protein